MRQLHLMAEAQGGFQGAGQFARGPYHRQRKQHGREAQAELRQRRLHDYPGGTG